MKKIAHAQSRRNSARRRRKVATRHARAGHWTAQPKPMLTSGKVSYEVGANIDATSFGGIAAMHRLAVKVGLVDELDDGLELLKVHLPYHESDHVLNLAYNVLCGGTRLEDIGQDPQCWKRQGPERAAALSLWLSAAVWLWYLDVWGARPSWKPTPWYPHKTRPSFADALAALRRTLWSQRITTVWPAEPLPPKIRDDLVHILATAA